LASQRPVEALLRDPLGEVARKERRSLLGISAIAILFGWTGLVPTEITNLGLKFGAPDHVALLSVFVVVVAYYLTAFIFYAFSDFVMHLRAVDLADLELKKSQERNFGLANIGRGEVSVETPWRLVRLVPLTSNGRIFVDFILPVIVAALAIACLGVGIYRVHNKHDSATGYSRTESQDTMALRVLPRPATLTSSRRVKKG
jgi:hypothetical protein